MAQFQAISSHRKRFEFILSKCRVENWIESKLDEHFQNFTRSPAFLAIQRRRREEERLEIGLYSIGVVDTSEENVQL